jgi:hypothetical protein
MKRRDFITLLSGATAYAAARRGRVRPEPWPFLTHRTRLCLTSFAGRKL